MKIIVGNVILKSVGDEAYLPIPVIKELAVIFGDNPKAPVFTGYAMHKEVRNHIRSKSIPASARFKYRSSMCQHAPAVVWMDYVRCHFPNLARAVAAEYWVDFILRDGHEHTAKAANDSFGSQIFTIHEEAVAKINRLCESYMREVMQDIMDDARQIVLRADHKSVQSLPIEREYIDEVAAHIVSALSRGQSFPDATEQATKYYEARLKPIVDGHRAAKNLPPHTGNLYLKLPLRK